MNQEDIITGHILKALAEMVSNSIAKDVNSLSSEEIDKVLSDAENVLDATCGDIFKMYVTLRNERDKRKSGDNKPPGFPDLNLRMN